MLGVDTTGFMLISHLSLSLSLSLSLFFFFSAPLSHYWESGKGGFFKYFFLFFQHLFSISQQSSKAVRRKRKESLEPAARYFSRLSLSRLEPS